ncbi:unnamed protein product [Caretta caretta]
MRLLQERPCSLWVTANLKGYQEIGIVGLTQSELRKTPIDFLRHWIRPCILVNDFSRIHFHISFKLRDERQAPCLHQP